MNHMEGSFVTGSAQETKELARQFAKKLKKGITLCLYGDLAAGKTTFTQGLGEYFGIDKMLSPTFVFVRQYKLKETFDHVKYLYHIDLYRLKSIDETKSFDLPEIWSDPANLVVIEWPDRLDGFLPTDRYDIRFKTAEPESREITFEAKGSVFSRNSR